MQDPVTHKPGIKKTNMTFQWLGVARSGARVALSGCQWPHMWLSVARSGPTVAFGKRCVFVENVMSFSDGVMGATVGLVVESF